MVLSLFSRRNNIVNIIITDRFIRYLELQQAKPPIAARWGERLLPNGIISNGKIQDYESLAMILDECVDEWKLRNRKVRFLIPESLVIIRKVMIPAEIKDDEMNGYLYLELGTSIHLPFEDPVFDAVVLSETNDKKEILLFAAPEENVMEYSQLFSGVKLHPMEAEVSPLALYRLYDHLGQAQEGENLLIVQFDLNTICICIFEQTIPIFMHYLPIELDEEKWDITYSSMEKEKLQFIGAESDLLFQFEDVYKEITRLMDFYRYSLHQGKKQVSKVLLHGDHPMLSVIKKELEKRLEIPLETIAYSETQSKENSLPRTHYLALGLALKGG